MGERQQILHLWLAAAALDTEVVAWAFYDGTDRGQQAPTDRPPTERPYHTGVEALRDGWMLLQAPGPVEVTSTSGELPGEFVFERRLDAE